MARWLTGAEQREEIDRLDEMGDGLTAVEAQDLLVAMREDIDAAYDELGRTLPEDLRDDAELVAGMTLELIDRLAAGEPYDQVVTSMETRDDMAQVDAANQALNDYAQRECGVSWIE